MDPGTNFILLTFRVRIEIWVILHKNLVIIEVNKDASFDAICEQMSRSPPWLPGIELWADGYERGFYMKA